MTRHLLHVDAELIAAGDTRGSGTAHATQEPMSLSVTLVYILSCHRTQWVGQEMVLRE